ncbi:MAG: DUF924 family protein [Ramlibacter sp.]
MDPSTDCAAAFLRFWRDAGPRRWFRKDSAFDATLRDRFLALHQAAARGDLRDWTHEAGGCLALVLLLDQFPRNAFRNTARAWSTDALARVVAQQGLDLQFDAHFVDEGLRNFFYLPFMHSEWLPDQQQALQLTRGLGTDAPTFAVVHHAVIQRFGRFPHRNALLGRRTLAQEQAFLDEGGFAG